MTVINDYLVSTEQPPDTNNVQNKANNLANSPSLKQNTGVVTGCNCGGNCASCKSSNSSHGTNQLLSNNALEILMNDPSYLPTINYQSKNGDVLDLIYDGYNQVNQLSIRNTIVSPGILKQTRAISNIQNNSQNSENSFTDENKITIQNTTKDLLNKYNNFDDYNNYLKQNNIRLGIEDNFFRIQIGSPDSFNPSVSLLTANSNASMSFYFDPLQVFKTQSTVETDGGLRTKIVDQMNDIDVLNIKYNKINDNWIPDTNISFIKNNNLKIPTNANLDMINLQTTAMWIGIQFLYIKHNQIYKKKNEKKAKVLGGGREYGNLGGRGEHPTQHPHHPAGWPDGSRQGNSDDSNIDFSPEGSNTNNTCTITHDLICSFTLGIGINPLGQVSVSSTNSNAYVNLPCIGGFNVDVKECCKGHDIKLWCTCGFWDAHLADIYLVTCIQNKILSAAKDLINQSFCYLISWFLEAEYEIFLDIIGSLIIFGFLLRDIYGYKDYLRNCDGRNSDCCLCNTNSQKPTFDLNGHILCGTWVGDAPVWNP